MRGAGRSPISKHKENPSRGRAGGGQIRLTKYEKSKIKKALLAAALDGNIQASKLLLGFADTTETEPLEKMSLEELEREKQKLLKELKEDK